MQPPGPGSGTVAKTIWHPDKASTNPQGRVTQSCYSQATQLCPPCAKSTIQFARSTKQNEASTARQWHQMATESSDHQGSTARMRHAQKGPLDLTALGETYYGCSPPTAPGMQLPAYCKGNGLPLQSSATSQTPDTLQIWGARISCAAAAGAYYDPTVTGNTGFLEHATATRSPPVRDGSHGRPGSHALVLYQGNKSHNSYTSQANGAMPQPTRKQVRHNTKAHRCKIDNGGWRQLRQNTCPVGSQLRADRCAMATDNLNASWRCRLL